jgi:hypothetical protein
MHDGVDWEWLRAAHPVYASRTLPIVQVLHLFRETDNVVWKIRSDARKGALHFTEDMLLAFLDVQVGATLKARGSQAP